MRRPNLVAVGVVAVVVLILLTQTFYVVDQTRQALVLRIGEPVRVVNAPPHNHPGLKVKIPFLESVQFFDKKSISYDAAGEEVLSSNQERLMVDAFVRYRITDPLQFYRSVQTEEQAQDRLRNLVNSSLRQALGSATTEQIIATQRAQIMLNVRQDVSRRVAESHFGVEIVDLRIRRADLPEANTQAVFDRMISQRAQEARLIRAEGAQQAQEILANAEREAQTIEGEGNAERARIFADSFGRDPSFAAFYRSMRAYETALASGETTLVLSPDSEFFRYFERGPGG